MSQTLKSCNNQFMDQSIRHAGSLALYSWQLVAFGCGAINRLMRLRLLLKSCSFQSMCSGSIDTSEYNLHLGIFNSLF